MTLGYRPWGTTADIPWMPKKRYQVMRQTLPVRGKLALDMMLMTSTGQVSLDWSSEADCARKVTATARLTPLLVALFANSPLVQGKPSGWMSYRSHVWSDVDPTRCGYFPRMLDGTFDYGAYVDWALKAPLLFLRRNGDYVMPAMTFGELLEHGYEGRPARCSDWTDHLSTLFPEVRIKRVMEVRGADSVSLEQTGGAGRAVAGAAVRRRVARRGAGAGAAAVVRRSTWRSTRRRSVTGYAGSCGGPRSRRWRWRWCGWRARAEHLDPDDIPLLEPLEARARSGRSPAEDVLEAFREETSPARFLSRFALLRD